MDLLTGYGSDDSDGEDIPMPVSVSAGTLRKDPQTTMQAAPQRQPTPQQHQLKPPPPSQPKAALDPGDGLAGEGSAGSRLWAQLPRPSSQTASAPSASSSGLAGLPPPSGGDARGGGSRKVVTMQLPFRKELLAAALDSDDEDEPAAKRVKATGAKSRLMDFLPPPKYDTGAVRVLGAPAASKAAGSAPVAVAGPASGSAGASASGSGAGDHLPAGFFSGGAAEPYGNEAYRVRDDGSTVAAAGDGQARSAGYPDATAGPYTYGAYDGSHDPSSYYAATYEPVGAAGRGAAGPVVGPTGPEDLIAKALRAEQERASKRGGGGGGGGGVKLVEVNAKDLTRMDPAAREASNSARDALGTEYALSLRRSAAPFEGSKMARRKHQIGTLLFNARMQELEHMEKRTAGQKSKAETAAKYGW